MIEIRQIQFTLGLGVKKSRLHYNQMSKFTQQSNPGHTMHSINTINETILRD